MFDDLIKQFAALRIDILEQEVNPTNLIDRLEMLNNTFVKLQDEWLTFSEEERKENGGKYVTAQSSFHFVGNYVIMKSKRQPTVVLPPTLTPATEAEEQLATQITFGDSIGGSNVEATTTTSVVTTTAPIMTTATETSTFSADDENVDALTASPAVQMEIDDSASSTKNGCSSIN